MIATVPQRFDIQAVCTIQPCNGALAVTFHSGVVAQLRPDHPERDAILRGPAGAFNINDRLASW